MGGTGVVGEMGEIGLMMRGWMTLALFSCLLCIVFMLTLHGFCAYFAWLSFFFRISLMPFPHAHYVSSALPLGLFCSSFTFLLPLVRTFLPLQDGLPN